MGYLNFKLYSINKFYVLGFEIIAHIFKLNFEADIYLIKVDFNYAY